MPNINKKIYLCTILIMKYSDIIYKKIKSNGIKKTWLSDKAMELFGMPRTTFWRKLDEGSLDKEEKRKINSLLK